MAKYDSILLDSSQPNAGAPEPPTVRPRRLAPQICKPVSDACLMQAPLAVGSPAVSTSSSAESLSPASNLQAALAAGKVDLPDVRSPRGPRGGHMRSAVPQSLARSSPPRLMGSELPPQPQPPPQPLSTSTGGLLDPEMQRRVSMTKQFTQLREEINSASGSEAALHVPTVPEVGGEEVGGEEAHVLPGEELGDLM